MSQPQIWPNSLVLEFIECYGTEPLIWDPSHPDHKNRTELNNAWARIQSRFSVDCSIDDLKKKKESLMTGFRLQIRKKKTNPSYSPTWFPFEHLEKFLGDVYYGEDETNSNQSCNKTEADQPFHNYSHNKSHSSPLVKKRRPDSSAYTSSHYTSSTMKNEDRCREDKGHMDESELYAQLLAKKLRRLNQDQRDIAMHQIDNIIFEIKMNNSQSRQGSYDPRMPNKSESPFFIADKHAEEEQYEEEYLEDPIQQDI